MESPINAPIVLARNYRTDGVCEELTYTVSNGYFVTRNGQIEDARQELDDAAAREFYDAAAYQLADRP